MTMKDTPQQLEARYSQILREREKHTDQSVEEFCRIRGISPWAYYSWKRRLRTKPEISQRQKKFLPVQLIGPTAATGNNDSAKKYEITFPNGITLRLSGSLQREDHAAIIGAIAGVHP
jgi:hypothetical protein